MRILAFLVAWLTCTQALAANVLPTITPGSAAVFILKPGRGAAVDTTPPVTTSGPAVSSPTSSGATLKVTINEQGTGYYYVQLASVSSDPSVATVMSSGVVFAMTGGAEMVQTISGLSASTNYKLYFVAKDASNNVQTAVQPVGGVAFTTSADSAVPIVLAPSTMTAGNPDSFSVTENAATFSVAVDKSATGYYFVQKGGTACGTAAQVKSATAANGGSASGSVLSPTSSQAMVGNVKLDVNVTGLLGGTAYWFCFVATNAIGDSAVAGAQITTAPDTTPPVWVTGPLSTAVTDTTASLNAAINEQGKIYYIVQLATVQGPSVTQVKAGTNGAGAAIGTASWKGNVSTTGNAVQTFSISSLAADTAYTVYFVAEDLASPVNVQVSAVGVSIKTTTGGGSGGWSNPSACDYSNALTYAASIPIGTCCYATNATHISRNRATNDATRVFVYKDSMFTKDDLGAVATKATDSTFVKKSTNNLAATNYWQKVSSCP